MDADGWFYVVDRKKDQINAAGYKVWPREVEDVLYGHPAVARSRSSASPTPTAARRSRPSSACARARACEAEELIAFCRERMAAYKRPRAGRVRRRAARTASGKVLRRALRDR